MKAKKAEMEAKKAEMETKKAEKEAKKAKKAEKEGKKADRCVLCEDSFKGVALRACAKCPRLFHHLCAIDLYETNEWIEPEEGNEVCISLLVLYN